MLLVQPCVANAEVGGVVVSSSGSPAMKIRSKSVISCMMISLITSKSEIMILRLLGERGYPLRLNRWSAEAEGVVVVVVVVVVAVGPADPGGPGGGLVR